MKTSEEIVRYVSDKADETVRMLAYASINHKEHVPIIQARLKALTEIVKYAFSDD